MYVLARPTITDWGSASPALNATRTFSNARFLERNLAILPDSALTYSTWRHLVAAHNVLGVKVHDAWLVAAMKAHGVNRILTFNASDFARYDGIEWVDPQAP